MTPDEIADLAEVRFTPAGIERGAIFTPWSNVVDVEYAPAVEEARDDATR